MVLDLAPWPHRREDGKIDMWHFEENDNTINIVGTHMLNLLRFVSGMYFDLHWMMKNKRNIEVSYAYALKRHPLKEPVPLVEHKSGLTITRYAHAGVTPLPSEETKLGHLTSPVLVSSPSPAWSMPISFCPVCRVRRCGCTVVSRSESSTMSGGPRWQRHQDGARWQAPAGNRHDVLRTKIALAACLCWRR